MKPEHDLKAIKSKCVLTNKALILLGREKSKNLISKLGFVKSAFPVIHPLLFHVCSKFK